MSAQDIQTNDLSMWRYCPVLPFANERVTLGEGATPLIEIDDGDLRFFVKAEWFNPTSSFKDRGVSTMVSALRSLGATRMLEDSSGNAGSSIAAYANASGIRAKIIVPASTSAQKLEQITMFGADIELVEGTRDDVGAVAMRYAESGEPYASHNWNPFFLQGIKTIGYEIWESLGFQTPDNVVTVAGSGSIPLGLELAFAELGVAADRTPRIYIGQPVGWDPIVCEIIGRTYKPTTHATLAEGASIGHPVRGVDVAKAVLDSGGTGVSIDDEEIATATKFLVSRGLFAEPTSAVAYAALRRLFLAGVIRASEQTVVVLTGSGFKATGAMRQALGRDDEDLS